MILFSFFEEEIRFSLFENLTKSSFITLISAAIEKKVRIKMIDKIKENVPTIK
jgi:hypothetical protein